MKVRRISVAIAIHVEDADSKEAEAVTDRLVDAEEEQDKLIDVIGELIKPFTELEGDFDVEHPSFLITKHK